MTDENETVEQVALSDRPLAEQIRIIRGNYCIGSGEFDALDEAADVVECHHREIAAKDEEIARLKGCVSGDCERTKLGAEPCANCFREHARQEIEKRDALIKELADALNHELEIGCSRCLVAHQSNKCPHPACDRIGNRALVAKAREAVK